MSETDMQYSYGNIKVSELMANHEEADTRFMLQSIYSGAQTIVVCTRSKILLSSYR